MILFNCIIPILCDFHINQKTPCGWRFWSTQATLNEELNHISLMVEHNFNGVPTETLYILCIGFVRCPIHVSLLRQCFGSIHILHKHRYRGGGEFDQCLSFLKTDRRKCYISLPMGGGTGGRWNIRETKASFSPWYFSLYSLRYNVAPIPNAIKFMAPLNICHLGHNLEV